MSTSKKILVDISESIATVTINRPEKHNAVTPAMLTELTGTLADMGSEGTVRCVVLRGAGDKAFSAGYDISSIGEQPDEMMRDYGGAHPLVLANRALEALPMPVIAMINGHAFGGSLELALACDIRVAADHALFAIPPAKLGIVYPYSGIRKFLTLIGIGHTRELFLTARTIDAARAERIGLVNHVVPGGELEDFTYAMARDIAANAPLSLRTMKLLINAWQESQGLRPDLEDELKGLIMAVQDSQDYKEGQRAFGEKRKPVFTGR